MRSDGVWHRIRWGNVARLCALVALAALVAAWPRLEGDPPRLPPAEPVPVAGGHAGGGASGGKRPRAKRQGGQGSRAKRRGGKRLRAKRHGAKRPRGGAKRQGAKRPRSGVTGAEGGPRPVAPPRVVPAPAVRRPPPDPAAAEFGLP